MPPRTALRHLVSGWLALELRGVVADLPGAGALTRCGPGTGETRTDKHDTSAAARGRSHDATASRGATTRLFQPGETFPSAPLNPGNTLQAPSDTAAAGVAVIAAPGRRERRNHAGGVRRPSRRSGAPRAKKYSWLDSRPRPSGVPAVPLSRVVHIDQVDVAGDVQFARAQLAHADDPRDGPDCVVPSSRAAVVQFGVEASGAGHIEREFRARAVTP